MPDLPSDERASIDSLCQQLHTDREEITRLQTENLNCANNSLGTSAPAAWQPPHDLITTVEDMYTTRKIFLHNRYRPKDQENWYYSDTAEAIGSGLLLDADVGM